MIFRIVGVVIGETISGSGKCENFRGNCDFSHEYFCEITILTRKITIFLRHSY